MKVKYKHGEKVTLIIDKDYMVSNTFDAYSNYGARLCVTNNTDQDCVEVEGIIIDTSMTESGFDGRYTVQIVVNPFLSVYFDIHELNIKPKKD